LGNPEKPLGYEQLNRADGLLTMQASVGAPNIAITPDGKMWVGTVKGLAMIDTSRLPLTGRKPKVFVSDIFTDGKRARVRKELVLSPGQHHVELQLAAVDLASAQKIRLQYRLEGLDSTWLDVGSSRTVVYTNIPPGTHGLELRATDSRGVWEEGGVVYEVTQQPFFYQPRVFQVSVLLAFVLLLAAAYIIRSRHLIRQTRAILEERQVERESVARDLHDTFLQGIQGLILRFHTGAQQLSAEEPVRQLFEEALRQSDEVMLEGRSVLGRLRSRRTTPQSLSNAFSAMGQEFRPLSTAQFEVIVSGGRRDLSTVVEEELQKIGREALFNSFRHAQATKIEVELHFGIFEFRLRFRDDGVGLDAAILRKGSVPGHYGLQGMKERVREVGGHMDLWSRAGAGTEIEVRIPSAIAYRESDARYRRAWLRRLLRARSS
jgi:signal transduction histidine kinase